MTAGPVRTEVERNMALLAYGLMGVSIFFAGVTALAAVVIAYVLQNATTEDLSRHFRFQIRIFWVGVACLVVAAISAIVAGLGAAGNLLHSAPPSDLIGRIEVWGFEADLSGLRITPLVIIALSVSAAAAFFGGLWAMIASAIGFIRLATSPGMGQIALK